jgi:hypothetical protein
MNFFGLFIHLFICAYIVLGHLSPLLPAPSLSSTSSSLPGRTFSALFSNFVEKKT